jgi:hypothetical protein
MTTPNQAIPVHHESTYQLLVESEEKPRTAIEDIVYLLLALAIAVTIWQFGHQPVTFADYGAPQSEMIM